MRRFFHGGRRRRNELRHSWDQGVEALQQRGESVTGLVGEDAEEETGPADGRSKEPAKDEQSVA